MSEWKKSFWMPSWFLIFWRKLNNLFTKVEILLLDLWIFCFSRKKQKRGKKPENLFFLPQDRLDQFEQRCFEGIRGFNVKGKRQRFQLALELSFLVSTDWLSSLRIHVIPRKNPTARILYKVAKVSFNGECVIEIIPYNWYWRYLAWRNVRCERVRAFCFISKNFKNEKYFCSSEEDLEWIQGELIRSFLN